MAAEKAVPEMAQDGSGTVGGAAEVHRDLCSRLLGARHAAGIWEGCLAPSALSTAVAAFALRSTGCPTDRGGVARGEAWLIRTQLADGTWGDTPESQGNLSTTLLVLAALQGVQGPEAAAARRRGEQWVAGRAGAFEPGAVAAAVLTHYGVDRTFSVPILTMCALAGLLGEAPECWRQIPPLPFELAVLPHRFFAVIGLPVVSYALPALIAMGLVRHRLGPGPRLGCRDWLAWLALRRLRRLQPVSGGFLEAIPLTGFVAMSLAACGEADGAVVHAALGFLRRSQRADGSWPIDSNLATWVTTLSVNALGDDLPSAAVPPIRDWLLRCQMLERHPYTGAAPGGWAWTDLPGGVPDADDTAGALLALHRLAGREPAAQRAATAGLQWLMHLMNRDGGLPTFCRGRGHLPFDRSCPDITAHALEAFATWEPDLGPRLRAPLRCAMSQAGVYLRGAQRLDGAWEPLWFGNEKAPGHHNPTYGTARVLRALTAVPALNAELGAAAERAAAWLVRAQHADGGWGGDRGVPPSLEETALAVSALAACSTVSARQATGRGLAWILAHQEELERPTPIGLYFASLWYWERLYPLIFSVDALRRALGASPSR